MLKYVGIILLLTALGVAQSNLELSEIETNPIPTVVNFDGFAITEEQPIMQSNVDFVGSFQSPIQQDSLINDPNNFFLDNLNQNIEMNAEGNYQNQDMSLNTIDTPQTQNWSQTEVSIQGKIISTVENSQDCIIIYSQCHYKGESQQLCQSTKNIDNFDHDIKSIYVPKGYVVRLYNKEDYTGEKIVMRESQECLAKPLSLMQLYGRQTANFMILAQNANLRAI